MYTAKYKDIEADRDKGMSYLVQGKDIFNSAKDTNTKEAGFRLFMKGLELLLTYLKSQLALHRTMLNRSLFQMNSTERCESQ